VKQLKDYLTLEKNQILLIKKKGNEIIYAVNNNGEMEIKKAKIPEYEGDE